jgi:putative oxidoreductase
VYGRDVLARWAPQLLSVLRIITALLYLQHASMKLLGFPVREGATHPALFSMFGALGVLELVGSVLLLIGLYSRVAAFILSGEMAVAYFIAHAPRSPFPLLNQGESAILFCFIYLYIAAAGPGPWSLDAARKR